MRKRVSASCTLSLRVSSSSTTTTATTPDDDKSAQHDDDDDELLPRPDILNDRPRMDHQTAQHTQYPVYYPQVAAPPPAVVHDGSGVTVGLGVGVGDVGEYGANGGGYGVYQGSMGQNGNSSTSE